MGMFDNVNFECDCSVCGRKVKGFQSKDGPRSLSNLEFWQVDNFYSHCDNCETRIIFYLEDEKLRIPENLKGEVRYHRKAIPIEKYRMEIRKPMHPERG